MLAVLDSRLFEATVKALNMRQKLFLVICVIRFIFTDKLFDKHKKKYLPNYLLHYLNHYSYFQI